MELAIIIIGLIIDRITKLWAINYLFDGKEIKVIKDFFSFLYLENTGAAFGVLRDKHTFLIVITSIVLVAIIVYLIKSKYSSRIFKLSLSLIISGAIGNLIDRVQYKYVVDFIMLHYKDKYCFPIFNVADILVTCGAVLLAIFIIKEDESEKKGICS